MTIQICLLAASVALGVCATGIDVEVARPRLPAEPVVLMEDCEFNGCRDAIYAKSLPGRGGYVRDVLIRNVKIGKCADAPVKLSLLYKKTPPNAPHVPDFSGFRIEDAEIEKGSPHPIVVEGVSHGPIRNVDFRNVRDASGRKPRVTHAKGVTFDGKVL